VRWTAPNDGQAKFNLGRQLASSVKWNRRSSLRGKRSPPSRCGPGTTGSQPYFLGLNRLDEAERAIRRAIELQPAAQGFHHDAHDHRNPARPCTGGARGRAAGASRNMAGQRARVRTADRYRPERGRCGASDADREAGHPRALPDRCRSTRCETTRRQTFEWLDRAWNNRDSGIQYLLFDPFILRYKDDPRFADVLSQRGPAGTDRDCVAQVHMTLCHGRCPLFAT
jgi:hypothetical protein